MRRYIAIGSALLLAFTAVAQNLNPTVQVTNAYDGKLMDISKKEIAMNVPDSLFRFDWDFNYSVFDNPYKGAYEFNPYVIEMRPEPSVYDGTRLYLRAGAGYSLHPEAQIVWNPNTRGRFGISVYNDFKGFFGDYADVVRNEMEPGVYKLERGEAAGGSDMSDRLGAMLRFDLPKAVLSLETGLDFIKTAGSDSASCFNSPLLVSNTVLANRNTLRARSNNPSSAFFYDLAAHFDVLAATSSRLADADATRINETAVGADLRLGYDFKPHYGLTFLAEADYFRPSSSRMPSATLAELTPLFHLSRERFHLETGVKLSKLWKSTVAPPSGMDDTYSFPNTNKRLIFPHLKLDFELVDDALVFFAGLTGGRDYNTCAGYFTSDHRFFFPSMADMAVLSDATVNAFDASLGFSGRMAHRLQYKIDGGYARMFNAPMQGIGVADLLTPFGFWYDMADYDLLYGDIEASWISDRLEFYTDMRLQKAEFRTFKSPVSLPLFSGSAMLRHNWNKRVYAGVSVDWATERHVEGQLPLLPPDDISYNSSDYHIPGWADLGLSFEYKTSGKFSVWTKAGNLLNQMVMRKLMLVERGPYFSVGISVNM